MSDFGPPLVTFALFAYNQEGFIREAVQAAFSQEYQPLQIVLSDDGSSDSTFKIMQEMAECYEGPHQVVARKTASNLGTLRHVVDVARISLGKLLVLAAGDDVSKPERCGVLVRAWQESGAWGLCSRFDRTNAAGKILERAVKSHVHSGHRIQQYFDGSGEPVGIVHGCTSAYDVRAFEYMNVSNRDYILAEDGAMSFLLNLLGKKVVHLDESLVLYRENSNSLTNSGSGKRASYSQIVADEEGIERFARSQANRSALFLRLNASLGDSRVRSVKVAELEADQQQQQLRASWSQMTFVARWRAVLSGGAGSWALPRLFGLNLFLVTKWLLRKFAGRRLNT